MIINKFQKSYHQNKTFVTLRLYPDFTDSKFSWNVGLKEFAHPAIEDREAGDSFQNFAFVAIFSPIFFYAISMFGFVFQISSMVLEKELKLRQVIYPF